jgi:hypothetical protein
MPETAIHERGRNINKTIMRLGDLIQNTVQNLSKIGADIFGVLGV